MLLADVGTDHALLPVAAVCRGVAKRAIAADLREAPLANARAHIERMGVADRVVAVRADGLLAVQTSRVGAGPEPGLEAPVDAVVISGMSADSMLRMFHAAPDVLTRLQQLMGQLILQPNQNVDKLRAWALRNGWHLRDERMLEEGGQFFVVCAFTPGVGADPAYSVAGWTTQALCSVGPQLLTRKDAVALRWFERQRARTSHWVKRAVKRLQPEHDVWDAACKAMRRGRDPCEP